MGCASSSDHDQTLEELMVGPVAVGMHRFILQAPAPDHTAIPDGDLLGVTVILITCSYMDKEFIRIGYYVNNELAGEYDPENPPPIVEITQVYRNILADKPVVTRIPIDWIGVDAQNNMSEPMQEAAYVPQTGAPTEQEFVMNEDSMDVEQMQFEPRRMFQN